MSNINPKKQTASKYPVLEGSSPSATPPTPAPMLSVFRDTHSQQSFLLTHLFYCDGPHFLKSPYPPCTMGMLRAFNSLWIFPVASSFYLSCNKVTRNLYILCPFAYSSCLSYKAVTEHMQIFLHNTQTKG